MGVCILQRITVEKLKILPNDKPNNLSFTLEEAKKGITKAQIQEKLYNQAKEQYNKVIEYLNQEGPVYTNMINSNMIIKASKGLS